MKRLYRIIAVGAAALGAVLAVSSCAIKEDRQECPCWLDVYFEQRDYLKDRAGEPVFTVTAQGYDDIVRRPSQDEIDGGLHVSVRKAYNTLSCYLRPGGATGLVVPEGEQCDSIYLWSHELDCYREQASDIVKLHKNFMTLKVRLLYEPDRLYPFDAKVETDCDGFAMPDLRPRKGLFSYEMPLAAGDAEGYCVGTVRLPRQETGEKLYLILSKREGTGRDTLHIGTKMLESRYNWGKPDLDDKVITIDYTSLEVSVRVDDWTGTEPMHTVI